MAVSTGLLRILLLTAIVLLSGCVSEPQIAPSSDPEEPSLRLQGEWDTEIRGNSVTYGAGGLTVKGEGDRLALRFQVTEQIERMISFEFGGRMVKGEDPSQFFYMSFINGDDDIYYGSLYAGELVGAVHGDSRFALDDPQRGLMTTGDGSIRATVTSLEPIPFGPGNWTFVVGLYPLREFTLQWDIDADVGIDVLSEAESGCSVGTLTDFGGGTAVAVHGPVTVATQVSTEWEVPNSMFGFVGIGHMIARYEVQVVAPQGTSTYTPESDEPALLDYLGQPGQYAIHIDHFIGAGFGPAPQYGYCLF